MLSFVSSAAWALSMLHDNIPLTRTPSEPHNKGSSRQSHSSNAPLNPLTIDAESFVRYRRYIEDRQPLARELRALRLGLLPLPLTLWADVKAAIQETIAHRKHLSFYSAQDLLLLQGQLTVGELCELLATFDVACSRAEGMRLLRLLRFRLVVFKELQRIYAKKRLAQADFPFEVESAKDTAATDNASPSRPTSRGSSAKNNNSKSSKSNSRANASQAGSRGSRDGRGGDSRGGDSRGGGSRGGVPGTVETDDGEDEEVARSRLVTRMLPTDREVTADHLQSAPLRPATALLVRLLLPLSADYLQLRRATSGRNAVDAHTNSAATSINKASAASATVINNKGGGKSGGQSTMRRTSSMISTASQPEAVLETNEEGNEEESERRWSDLFLGHVSSFSASPLRYLLFSAPLQCAIFVRRYLDNPCRFLFLLAQHLNDRLVFRDQQPLNLLPATLHETAVFKASISLGDSDHHNHSNSSSDNHTHNPSASSSSTAPVNVNSGLSLHLKSSRVDSLDNVMKRLVPSSSGEGGSSVSSVAGASAASSYANSGLCVVCDLLVKPHNQMPPRTSSTSPVLPLGSSLSAQEEEEVWRGGAVLLRQFLQTQFVDVVFKQQNASAFHSLQVLVARSELDDALVYRVVLAYKRHVGVDSWLQQCLVPYTLNDLLCACAMDLKTSLDLHRLCLTSSPTSSLLDLLQLRLQRQGEQRISPHSPANDKRSSAISPQTPTQQQRLSVFDSPLPSASKPTHPAQPTDKPKSDGNSFDEYTRERDQWLQVAEHLQRSKDPLFKKETVPEDTSTQASLNDLFHGVLSCTVSLRHRLLAQLLKRLTNALKSGLCIAHNALLQKQQQPPPPQPPSSSSTTSTAASADQPTTGSSKNNDGNHHESAEVSTVTSEAASTQSSDPSQPTPHRSVPASAMASSIASSLSAAQQQREAEDAQMRFARYQSIFPHYPHLAHHLASWTHYLDSLAQSTLRIHYRSLWDCATRLGLRSGRFAQIWGSGVLGRFGQSGDVGSSDGSWDLVGPWLRYLGSWVWGDEEVLLGKGGVQRQIVQWQQRFQAELAQQFQRTLRYLQEQREREERQRLHLLLHGTSKATQEGQVEDHTSSAQTRKLLQEVSCWGGAKEVLQQAEADEMAKMITTLRTLDLLKRHVVGLHSIEVKICFMQ